MELLDVKYRPGKDYRELFSVMIDPVKCADTAVGITDDGKLLLIDSRLANYSSAYWVDSVFFGIDVDEFREFLKQAGERGYIERAIENGQTTEDELKMLADRYQID